MGNEAQWFRDRFPSRPITRRGRNYIEFDLGNGQKALGSSIAPLHLRASETEIDTAWVADTGAWQWKIASTDYQAHARDVFNAGNLYEWRKGEHWIVVDPQSINWINQDLSRQQIAIKQAVTGEPTDETMRFTAAYGAGRHFEYVAHPKRLIKHVIIDSLSDLPAPTVTGDIEFEAEFTISTSTGLDLYLDGVKWAKTNGVRVRTANKIDFRDASNTPLWYADAPTATDANRDVCPAEYEVRRQGGPSSLFITVRVPREWLLTAAYPVKIDPTFTDGYGGDATTAKDDMVLGIDGVYKNWNHGAAPRWGAQGSSSKELYEFDASSIADTATCDSATLYVYKAVQSGTSEAFTITLYSIASGNAAWTEGTKSYAAAGSGEPCWNALASDGAGGVTTAWAGSAGLSTSGTDYEASSLGSFNGNKNDVAGTEYSTALTPSRVEGWFGATNTNYGLLATLSGNAEDLATSDHATTGYRPKLVVVYTEGGATKSVSDSGAGADAISGVAVSLALADTGSGTESFASAASLGLADTGTGSDALAAILASLSISDSGAGVDVPGILAALGLADTGAGADIFGINVSLSVAEIGSGTDLVDVLSAMLKQVADSGSGADGLAVNVAVAVSDIGNGADSASQIIVTLTVSDAGAGADLVSVLGGGLVSILESGSGVDGISIAVAPLSISDSGAGADSLVIRATVGLSDTANGADAINVLQTAYKLITELATGTDAIGSVSVSLAVPESGSGSDMLAQIVAWVVLAESGSGVDVAVAFDSAVRIATITFSIARRTIVFTFASREIEFNLAQREIEFELN
jgi:hypothetical protein